jgi:hypothetical protein
MSKREREYAVGFGKPPLHTRFGKGRSGNPKGRPKGSRNLAGMLHRILNERIVVKENGERRRITKLEATFKQLANKAACGDARALRELLRIESVFAPPNRAADPGQRPRTLEELVLASYNHENRSDEK